MIQKLLINSKCYSEKNDQTKWHIKDNYNANSEAYMNVWRDQEKLIDIMVRLSVNLFFNDNVLKLVLSYKTSVWNPILHCMTQ